eukprot:3888010-Amphidinium_carterae.4
MSRAEAATLKGCTQFYDAQLWALGMCSQMRAVSNPLDWQAWAPCSIRGGTMHLSRCSYKASNSRLRS